MSKEEFEELINRRVTPSQYRSIETLYMQSSMDKREFSKLILPIVKSLEKEVEERPNPIVRVNVKNSFGQDKTPNGMWYYVVFAEVLDYDIRTGKVIVKTCENQPDELSSSYDYLENQVKFKKTKLRCS